jgi:hypothetical protein
MNRLMRMLMAQNGYMAEAGADGEAGGGGEGEAGSGEGTKTYTQDEVQAMIEEQTGGLKKKMDELLGEKKSATQKANELEAANRTADEERQKEKGEFKELYEKTQAELEEERNSNKTWKEQLQQRDIKEKASRIGNDLAKSDTKRAEVLADYVGRYAKHDGETVTYEIGGIEVTADKLKEHLTMEFPFLVDGNGSSGGGATGARGGAASDKSAKRAQFDSMGQNERAKFIKDGGKVVAD